MIKIFKNVKDLWILFPLGAGGLVGILARENIDALLRGFGFNDNVERLAGIGTTTLGVYLTLNYDGNVKTIGTGIGTIGMILLMTGFFEMDYIYDMFEMQTAQGDENDDPELSLTNRTYSVDEYQKDNDVYPSSIK